MENDLLKRSAFVCSRGCLEGAEDVTKERNKDLAAFIAQVMSPLAASFLSAWCTQFVLLCLQALSDEPSIGQNAEGLAEARCWSTKYWALTAEDGAVSGVQQGWGDS
jgi:hypothetical protein